MLSFSGSSIIDAIYSLSSGRFNVTVRDRDAFAVNIRQIIIKNVQKSKPYITQM